MSSNLFLQYNNLCGPASSTSVEMDASMKENNVICVENVTIAEFELLRRIVLLIASETIFLFGFQQLGPPVKS